MANAQLVKTDSVAQLEISKLEFLVGEWQGSGWMMGQDRQRHEFDQTENIQFKLDNTLLLIEGLGTSQGQTIHNALAIVSFNTAENNYLFTSYLANGRKGEFKAELEDEKFTWFPRENTRYVIEINDAGQWFEVGEFNRQGNWYKFFEMTLNKK